MNTKNTTVAGLPVQSDNLSTNNTVPALDNQRAVLPAEPHFVFFQGPASTRNHEGDTLRYFIRERREVALF